MQLSTMNGIAIEQYEQAAKDIGCDVAAILAVAKVESNCRGFLKQGCPKIRFEKDRFEHDMSVSQKMTADDLNQSNSPKIYNGCKTKTYGHLQKAMSIDKDYAFKCTNWGLFQVVGFNYSLAGFDNIDNFVSSMKESELNQLQAFVHLISHGDTQTNHYRHLQEALCKKYWLSFSIGYNDLKKKERIYYDMYLKAYYKVFSVQLALNEHGIWVGIDGDESPQTRSALKVYQERVGLRVDGMLGISTLQSLDIVA